jgi:SAM-dependent methyltransferase
VKTPAPYRRVLIPAPNDLAGDCSRGSPCDELHMTPDDASSVQVGPDHYAGSTYDTKHRFISYWHQVDAVLRRRPRNVLEVGKGNGFVSEYLKTCGLQVRSVDFDYMLHPDAVATVGALPLRTSSFDVVLCAQVLEHIPLASVPTALGEINRVSRNGVVVSVPDVTAYVRLLLPVPGRPERELLLPRWWKRARIHVTNEQEHEWEIGVRGYGLGNFRKDLRRAGFRVDRTFRVFEHPYHRFFELSVA